jgi:hypothetical protein
MPKDNNKTNDKNFLFHDFELKSSHIKNVEYDPFMKVLTVTFHQGGIYSYIEVERYTYNEFIRADSPGKYFASSIKGKFEMLNKTKKKKKVVDKKGFSKEFERDWDFYFLNKDKVTFCGSSNEEIIKRFNIVQDVLGITAKEAFLQIDSYGKAKPCCEMDLLVQMLRTKAAWNLQIKQWAQGAFDLCPAFWELDGWCAEYEAPAWVAEAVRAQYKKIIREGH